MISKEEICEIRDDLQKGVKMFVKELERLSREKTMGLSEAFALSDMLKDMSEVEKNLAKASYYDRKTN